MDSIATVKDAFDKVTKKQNRYHSVSLGVIDQVCDGIEETLSRIELDNDGLESESVVTELSLKLESLLPIFQLQGSQKEMNMRLSKFVKLLESSCHCDMSLGFGSVDFDIRQVNKILVYHFYRQGLFEVGDCLAKEAEVEVETEVRSQSLEIFRLTESLKLGNIEPAMRWISANRVKLNQNGSKLELKLVSFKYCEMLREGNRLDDALKYARIHFPRYASLNWIEIKRLINALLWAGKLEKSPYAEMVSALHRDKVTKELTKQYYKLLDQPSNSPLAVALSAGLVSLPILLKLIHVMGLKKQEWQAMKQLPVPLELGNEFQFHSVFVCPVSKDESSEENPPMMLPCRHVLCKQSITRISKKNRYRRFKCPYCPAETSASACKQLFF